MWRRGEMTHIKVVLSKTSDSPSKRLVNHQPQRQPHTSPLGLDARGSAVTHRSPYLTPGPIIHHWAKESLRYWVEL